MSAVTSVDPAFTKFMENTSERNYMLNVGCFIDIKAENYTKDTEQWTLNFHKVRISSWYELYDCINHPDVKSSNKVSILCTYSRSEQLITYVFEQTATYYMTSIVSLDVCANKKICKTYNNNTQQYDRDQNIYTKWYESCITYLGYINYNKITISFTLDTFAHVLFGMGYL